MSFPATEKRVAIIRDLYGDDGAEALERALIFLVGHLGREVLVTCERLLAEEDSRRARL